MGKKFIVLAGNLTDEIPMPMKPTSELGIARNDARELSLLSMREWSASNPEVQALLRQVESELRGFRDALTLQVQSDFRRVGAELVKLGFPDPLEIDDGWQIIARMVGAPPDDFVVEKYEAANRVASPSKVR